MKRIANVFCIVAATALMFTACSAEKSSVANTSVATTAAMTTEATTEATTEETTEAVDPVMKLRDVSDDVTLLWNEVIVEVRDYAKSGLSSTGEPLDIDFVLEHMDKYYNKVTEDKAFMDSLGDEYSDLKSAFNKLYDKATIIYNNLKAETPVANKPLSYADEIDLFQQYHTYFYDTICEL